MGYVAALGALLLAPDLVSPIMCSAPENLPCRPLTLECLFAGAGGLAAGLPAVPPGYGGQPAGPYDENPVPGGPREYAPSPPPGYQPPPPRSPQDVLNDPDFYKAKEDWARDNADRVYPSAPPIVDVGGIADIVVRSIRHSGDRR